MADDASPVRPVPSPGAGGDRLVLGERFEQALLYAVDAHRHQWRKASGEPYVSHLLAVAGLVLEDGGSEDEAVAALLHDAVEDQGGAARLADIDARFGATVAALVSSLTDTDVDPKPPWRPRKEAYLQHLAAEASPAALRVASADKLHNARSILRDLRDHGAAVWDRFNAGPDEQLWYYHSLVAVLTDRRPGPLVDDLRAVVTAIADEVARSEPR